MRVDLSPRLRAGVIIACVLFACGKSQPTHHGTRGGSGPGGPGLQFPVEVERVVARSLQYHITAVGSLEAFERVQITARVAGVVERVRFREGDAVKQGETLVEIEPDRYRLEAEEKKAMLERADASLLDAESQLRRREAASASTPGLIRGEEMESFRMRARTAKADELAAKTALERALLSLRDALVRAPLAGIVQSRSVQTGQYVQPGAVLATMIRRDPMLLRFKVPVREAEPLFRGMKVEFKTKNEGRRRSATISLVTDLAEEASRMVAVTAEVDAEDAKELRPGTFAEVAITHGRPREVPVVPATAIRPSERGFLAFVVENNVAKERVLELGMRTLDGGAEVTSGLVEGEVVVIRGAEALRDGAAVRVVENPNDRARGAVSADHPPGSP